MLYSQIVNRYTLLDAYPLLNINEEISKIAKWNMFSTLDLKSAYYQIPLCPADRPFIAFKADGKLYQYTRLPFGVTNGVSCFQRIVDNLIEKYNLIVTYAYLENITVSGRDDCDHNDNLNSLFDAAKCEGLTFNKSKCLFSRREINLLGYRVSHYKIKRASEQTTDHVLTACPIHRAPHGARGLTVLDDETRCWLNDITASI